MNRTLFVCTALAGFSLLAADRLMPANTQLGLWEITATSQTTGLPNPTQKKQRASSPSTIPVTRQICITQDKLENAPSSEHAKSCQRTIVTSTADVVEFHEECIMGDGSRTMADVRYEITGNDSMKGTIKLKMTVAGHQLEINTEQSSKWLGADCGSVK